MEQHDSLKHLDLVKWLNVVNEQFRHLLADYRAMDRMVRRMEMGAEPVSIPTLRARKLARKRLKDQVDAILTSYSAKTGAYGPN